MKQKRACAVVVGVGAARGIRAACCRRFASEGMAVVVVGRSPHKIDAVAAELRADGATAMAVACDVTRPGDVERLFVGGRRCRLAACAARLQRGQQCREALPQADARGHRDHLAPMRPGWIHGGAGGPSHACLKPTHPAPWSLPVRRPRCAHVPPLAPLPPPRLPSAPWPSRWRANMAPEGIHVAHVIIDGIVDGEQVDRAFKGAGRALRLAKGKNGTLQPDSVADTYWQLHQQPADAWVHELDLRPAAESF